MTAKLPAFLREQLTKYKKFKFLKVSNDSRFYKNQFNLINFRRKLK